MQIDRHILARHLHEAAAEHLAAEYRSRGYDVQAEVPIDGHHADLVAKRDEEIIVFEIKTAQWSKAAMRQIQQLREHVVNDVGGRFHLVFAHLPDPIEVEVESMENVLRELAEERVADQLAGWASHFHSLFVSDVDYETLRIQEGAIEVKGTAFLSLTLQYGSDGDVARDDGLETEASLPLQFHVRLNSDLGLEEVFEFVIVQEPDEVDEPPGS